MSGRNPKTLGIWGPNGTRVVAAEAQWKLPLKWNKAAATGVCHACFGRGMLTKETCVSCKGTGKEGDGSPYRARVFCASLADVFELRELAKWADISDGYRISIYGEIQSQWRAGGYRGEWERMQTRTDDGGYETIQLRKHPTLGEKTLKAHRLLLQAFIGSGPDGHVVRHLDGRRNNNVLWNLAYSSQSDNLSDRAAHGTDITGERNGRSKLTEEDVERIRILLGQGRSQSSIASEFGVKQVAISRIKLGKSWSPKASVGTEPIRTCVPGQVIDSSGRPVFVVPNGFSTYPDGETGHWKPASLDDVRNRLFRLIDATPNLDWLILTKRPENIMKMWPPLANSNMTVPLREILIRKNVWLGTSVENQEQADKRIPELLKTPAAVRFLSAEPLLGPIAFDNGWSVRGKPWVENGSPAGISEGIDLVIVGGESGHGARPCNIEWIRAIVQQCKASGVQCFVKQVGARPYEMAFDGSAVRSWGDAAIQTNGEFVQIHLKDKKGGDMEEWPADLRVREMPR
jgi:protein gp37